MARFGDLPDELVLLVCHHLLQLVPNRELLSLSRVNWRLNRLTLPLFWRDVQIPQTELLNLNLYAAIILEGNTIAPLIKCIRLTGYRFPTYQVGEIETDEERERNERIVDGLAERVSDIFEGDERFGPVWRQGIESQDAACMISLLLVHFPNLESLLCGQWQDTDWFAAGKLWPALNTITKQMVEDDRLPADRKPFLKIREASISALPDPEIKGTMSVSLLVVSHWPAIESLQVARTGNARWLMSTFDNLKPKSLKLKRIRLLSHCNLAPAQLRGLLCASSCLRTFQFHLNEYWGRAPMHLDFVQAGLESNNDTLQHVILYTTREVSDVQHGTYSGFYLVDYSRLTRLTHLCISYIFFFGCQVHVRPEQALNRRLPPSITKLQIVQVFDKLLSYVEQGLAGLFAPGRQGLVAPDPLRQFPDLKTIHIGIYTDRVFDEATHGRRCSRMEDLCAGSEIGLQFFDYHEPGGTDEPLLTRFGVPEDAHPGFV